jgi:K+-sensing histidine kinase KdpD
VTTTLEARFLAVISHELRTPLTAIASFTESLDTDDLAPGARSQAVSAVRRNTERMLTLVDDLLLVSRLRNGDLSLNPASVDPAALLQEAADLLNAREPTTFTTLSVGAAPKLSADGPLLRELFYAALGTVASAAADRAVEVSSSMEADHWRVTITALRATRLTDEQLMAGMLADPQPPHRLRSTALWMLLAEAIATRHGGAIELTFEPGAGAGAEIKLPLTIPSA